MLHVSQSAGGSPLRLEQPFGLCESADHPMHGPAVGHKGTGKLDGHGDDTACSD